MRSFTRHLSWATGLWFAFSMPVLASEPAQSPGNEPSPLSLSIPADTATRNQVLADRVAAGLRGLTALKHFQVNITAHGGIVELDGFVSWISDQEDVVQTALAVPGVSQVINRLQVRDPASLQRATSPVSMAQFQGGPPIVGTPPQKENNAPPAGQNPEPTPIFKAVPPGPVPNAYQPPKMPPYSWPTYAPYNNYSRVAYPQLYPYNSWPYVGPFYPFPKIPPGWRSVTLTWEDGYWWYGRNSTGHDWWRARFW